jgi:ferritin
MKSNEFGTTLKHLETINGNVKNLSERMKMKDKDKVTFSFIFHFHPFTLRI